MGEQVDPMRRQQKRVGLFHYIPFKITPKRCVTITIPASDLPSERDTCTIYCTSLIYITAFIAHSMHSTLIYRSISYVRFLVFLNVVAYTPETI